jgi:hypothetical protein
MTTIARAAHARARALPLTAGIAVAVCALVLSGCGSSGGAKGSNHPVASTPAASPQLALQDAAAKNQSRALLQLVYECDGGAEQYQHCTTEHELGNTGLPIGKQRGHSEVVGQGGRLELITRSESGNTFFQRSPDAHSELLRSCTTVAASPSCVNGTW